MSEVKIGNGFSQLNARILIFFSFGSYFKLGTKYEIVYSKRFWAFCSQLSRRWFLNSVLILVNFNSFMAFGHDQNKYVLADFIWSHPFRKIKFLGLPTCLPFHKYDVTRWIRKRP